MVSRTGYVGLRGDYTSFETIQDINVKLQETEYPTSIDIALHTGSQDPTDDCYFRNRYNHQLAINLYLTDWPNHNFEIQLGVWSIPEGGTDGTDKHFTISKTDALKLRNKWLGLEMKNTAPSGSGIDSRIYTELYGRAGITVHTDNDPYFTLTPLAVGTDGYVNVSSTKPAYKSEVTLTPVPSAGYYLSSYIITADAGGTVPTVTNHKFRMPANDLTVKGNFSKYTYTISKATNPSGAGTVTVSRSTAQVGDSVTVSQTAGTRYLFTGWTTSPANLISNNAFTMPASNVSVTANYKRWSSATLSSSTLTGNGTVTLAIQADKSSYNHKYKLSFGTNMETGWVDVAAGVSSVSISVPDSWSNYIPAATQKTGGSMQVRTYDGSSLIGTYTISNLVYKVRSTAVPTIGTITTSIVRGSFANIGEIYTQNHSYVRIQVTATGVLSSTIGNVKVTVSGYSGSSYEQTIYPGTSSGSIDFTTGILTKAGATTITVTTTDSRGRTASKTASITVTAYNAPSAALRVWRVDAEGMADDMGVYSKYEVTNKTYSAIGSNTLTTTLTYPGESAVTIANDTGDILPNDRQQTDIQTEKTITLTLTDAFHTVTVTAKLPTARFLIYVSANGKKLGFMKATNRGGANEKTIEFDGDSTIYIGEMTLAQYIQSIVSNM